MSFIALEKLHLLYDGYRKPVILAGKPCLLLQEAGQVRLIRNACPHASAPLTHATYADGCLRCPVHGMEFELATGRSRNASCANGLQFVALVYEGNQVGVDSIDSEN
jgi:nitrite reductase/ring-hydroxylating ferredoxin subunit